MIIQANTCRTCKFAMRLPVNPNAPDHEFQCRRFPPTGGPVAIPIRQGEIMLQMHGGFMPVGGDIWCGEYKPRIHEATAANDNTPLDLKEYLNNARKEQIAA